MLFYNSPNKSPTKEILVYCWLGENKYKNLGEHLIRPILKKIGYNVKLCYDDITDPNIRQKFKTCCLTLGSDLKEDIVSKILSNIPKLVIWGHGNGRHKGTIVKWDTYGERIKIFALRGPLTYQQTKLKSTVPLCDPGFLFSHFYPMPTSNRDETYYVPHWDNRSNIDEKLTKLNVNKYLDICVHEDDLFNMVKKLSSANFVLTNSMHCLIICLCYKTPCAISILSEESLNMPNKWKDLFQSMNDYNSFETVSNINEGIKWWETKGQYLKIPDIQPLIQSFPHHLFN